MNIAEALNAEPPVDQNPIMKTTGKIKKWVIAILISGILVLIIALSAALAGYLALSGIWAPPLAALGVAGFALVLFATLMILFSSKIRVYE